MEFSAFGVELKLQIDFDFGIMKFFVNIVLMFKIIFVNVDFVLIFKMVFFTQEFFSVTITPNEYPKIDLFYVVAF